jgi:hypothetical protein
MEAIGFNDYWGPILLAIITVVIAIFLAVAQLPLEIRNISWWLLVFAIFLIVIAWLMFQRSRKEE